MRLVHLSDLHLGFRQYQRLTPTGINQREADVAATVSRAVAQIIACAPDLIVVGGDVFHTVRPSNPAILHAFRTFSALRDRLPETPIVMVAGNHDAPRTSETGCILRLFREIGVHVADAKAELFTFAGRSLAVLAVPDVPGIDRPPFVPPEGYEHTVLRLHGEIAGMLPAHAAPADRAAIEIDPAELHAEQWSYVALGHYHVYREVATRAYYSGSLDYTSSNPWGELREEREQRIPGKGFIEHDLVSGAHRFHPVAPSRPLLDLEPIDASGMGATDVDSALRASRCATSRGTSCGSSITTRCASIGSAPCTSISTRVDRKYWRVAARAKGRQAVGPRCPSWWQSACTSARCRLGWIASTSSPSACAISSRPKTRRWPPFPCWRADECD